MSAGAVVIGLGNRYRRDDAVGIAIAEAVAALRLPGVRVVADIAEPTAVFDVWADADLAVVVDAALTGTAQPGQVRRCDIADLSGQPTMSSHAMNVQQTYSLGWELGRIPRRLVVLVVEAADTGHGVGLSSPVAAAVPRAVGLVVAEFRTPVTTSARGHHNEKP